MISVIMLFGCAGNTDLVEKPKPPDTFSTNFSSGEFEGTFSFKNNGDSIVEFTKPDSVAGLKFIIGNTKTTMEYMGMTHNCRNLGGNSLTLAETIVKAMVCLISENENIQSVLEKSVIVRKTEDFTLYQNSDGTPIRLISGKFDVSFA